MYYVGLRQENWETRCGYVYEMTIRLKDHADQLVCSAYTPVYDARPALFTVLCQYQMNNTTSIIGAQQTQCDLMLDQRLRHRSNIVSALGQRIVVALYQQLAALA